MRRRLIVGGAVAVLLVAGGGYVGLRAWKDAHAITHADVRGSSTVEFDPSASDTGTGGPATTAPATSESTATTPSAPVGVPWTTYGYDLGRNRVAPGDLRPPYRVSWRRSVGIIEFPPTVVGDTVYLQLQRGPIYALDAATGAIRWKRDFKRCAASQPTLVGGVLYAAYMHPGCVKHQAGARGFLLALDATSGRTLWRFDAGAIESSPLVVGGLIYFGSWDQKVYALDLATHRLRWSYATGSNISSSPAYGSGAIYIGSDDGRIFALDARSGALRWQNASFGSALGGREYFYATPAVGYGRVFIGNTDGRVYAFGARSGKLVWATRAGSYVYSSAAVWNRLVYVGSWDGNVSALDAATGEIRWQTALPSSIHGAPTVMAGLVYFSTLDHCCFDALRAVKQGPKGTFALDARTGRIVWRFGDGGYSPLVTDTIRAYLVGRGTIYALVPRS